MAAGADRPRAVNRHRFPNARQSTILSLCYGLFAAKQIIGEKMERTEERADYIGKIRAAELLDAVFLLFYYNEWSRQWGPQSERPPEIDLSEALPTLSQPTYEHALALARRMWKDATAVGLAFHQYPQAKRTFEEEVVAFKTENPGFSEESYEMAKHAAFISLR